MNQVTTVDTNNVQRFELAKAFSTSKLVPEHFKNSVGDCYIAIGLAERYHMDAWSLMQEMYIIQGKPMMSGKLATAILNHSLAEPLRPEYSGEGDERKVVVTGRPHGDEKPLSVDLKVKDAKTANDQWKKNPDQMLMYAGARMWGRRYTPDILLGILFDDEDVGQDATLQPPMPTSQITAPQAQQRPARADVIDDKTGEVLDHPVELPKREEEKWYDWGARLVACIRSAPDIDTIDQWLAKNADAFEVCAKEAQKVHRNISSAVNQAKMELLNAENAAEGQTTQ